MASDEERRIKVCGSFRLCGFLTLLAGVSLVSCTNDPSSSSPTSGPVTTTAPSVPFGSATVQPSAVKRGGLVTVTPSAEIQPICGGYAMVRSGLSDHGPIIQLGGGSWVSYATTQPTWLACLPPRSSASASLSIAGDFPVGTFVVCLTFDLTDEGCGTMTVAA